MTLLYYAVDEDLEKFRLLVQSLATLFYRSKDPEKGTSKF